MTNNVLKMKEENQQNFMVDESDIKSLIKLLEKEKTEFNENVSRLERFKNDLYFWNYQRPLIFDSKDERYVDTYSRKVHLFGEIKNVQSKYQKHISHLEDKIKSYEGLLGY